MNIWVAPKKKLIESNESPRTVTASHAGASSGGGVEIDWMPSQVWLAKTESAPFVMARCVGFVAYSWTWDVHACMHACAVSKSDHLLECALETARRPSSLSCVRLLIRRALCSAPSSKYSRIPLSFLRTMSCPPFNPSYAKRRQSRPPVFAAAHCIGSPKRSIFLPPGTS
ncbi:hypothetical protein ACQKWADRAFT_80591 [Trichoderma austrokoningii]